MPHGNSERLDAVFHALSDSTRRTILDELSKRNDQTLFEICVQLIDVHGMTMSRQAISKHLAVLEDAKLIRTGWQGRTKLHSSNLPKALPLLAKWLDNHGKWP